MKNREFATISPRGLRQDLPPMHLWQKAKKLGIWNPTDIDFTQDKIDWERLSGPEQDAILRQCSLFLAAEESVTRDLLPLIEVVAREGRIEEVIYLTSFLWEEAKHVEGFCRFFDEVTQDHSDLSRFHGQAYRKLFYEELPATMNRLRKDSSVVAQVRASVTYNLIIEGVLAETGYHGLNTVLTMNGLMPGMQQFISYLKRDESRHIAFAIYFLSRLVAEHGNQAWEALEERMNELLPLAIATTAECFEPYGDNIPFNLKAEAFTEYAAMQFMKRMERISKSKDQRLEEICTIANTTDEAMA